MKTKKTRPIPIRMDQELSDRLDRVARILSSSRSSVIRLSIIQTLPEIESGKLILKAAI